MNASLKAFALIALPLVCGAVLFAVVAPGERPGVYVGTRQGIYPIAGYSKSSQNLFADVADNIQTAPASARGLVTFFVVGDEPNAAVRRAASAKLFFVRVIEGEAPQFRPMSTRVEWLDAHVFHVVSDEMAHWGDAPDPVVKYYFEAKATTAKPIKVLVALTMDDQDGSQRIYPVLNYPASGPPLVLPAYRVR